MPSQGGPRHTHIFPCVSQALLTRHFLRCGLLVKVALSPAGCVYPRWLVARRLGQVTTMARGRLGRCAGVALRRFCVRVRTAHTTVDRSIAKFESNTLPKKQRRFSLYSTAKDELNIPLTQPHSTVSSAVPVEEVGGVAGRRTHSMSLSYTHHPNPDQGWARASSRPLQNPLLPRSAGEASHPDSNGTR